MGGGFVPLVLPYVNRESFNRGSFLVGLAIGRIWNHYRKASQVDKRKANLSLGDFLWRLNEGWQKARNGEDDLKVAIETRFTLIKTGTLKTQLAVIEMADDFDSLLRGFQRFMNRDNLLPDNKKGALFHEGAKIFPQLQHADIVHWYDAGMTPVDIAQAMIALKYGIKTSSLKRLLTRAKTLSEMERSRHAWLQSYNNHSNPSLNDISLSIFSQTFSKPRR